ncbi:MAG TPA: hypothetical protein VKV57_14670 [bacterium]|nr:hypothetical protein [bacterium]
MLLVCAALGTSIGAFDAAAAATSATGEIRGVVLDDTPPVHPVAGQRVNLEIVERGSTSTRGTTTDPKGRFAFSSLPLGGIRVFLVQVQYGGVSYTARAALTPAVPARDVQLSVFESTEDRTALHGTIAFAVVEPLQRGLRVSVIQRLQNATDRAIVATDADPLVFPLPQVSPLPLGPEPVEFVGGWRDPQVARGTITDATPVLPGTMEVAYTFRFEPRTRTATLRWLLPYGATDVELLVDHSIRASGIGVRANGSITERGRPYIRLSGGPVRAGTAVSVRLDGLLVSRDLWPEIVAGMLALTLAYGLAAALRRRPPASH